MAKPAMSAEGFDVGGFCVETEKLLCSLSRVIPGVGVVKVCSFMASTDLGRRRSSRPHWSTAQAIFVDVIFS